MAQSEAQLEEQLITQLTTLGYERITIPDTAALRANLKTQIEAHNDTTFSHGEFRQILNHLEKGNIFAKAETLRGRFQLGRDDGSTRYIQFLNSEHWCQNRYQVTHQITVKGKRTNRYDVTLLINGLPLAQIELKKRGGELKEAFNQINRSKMICRYIVRHQTNKILMVLRPDQYYAVEAIMERVRETDKHGYIWHTTGSGKTLTSFKAAQLLTAPSLATPTNGSTTSSAVPRCSASPEHPSSKRTPPLTSTASVARPIYSTNSSTAMSSPTPLPTTTC